MDWTALTELLKTISPVVGIGVVWKIGHLYTLRARQKDAFNNLCDEIITLPDTSDTEALIRKLNRLKAVQAFYDKSLFNGKTPLGMIPGIIDLSALVQSVFDSWDHYRERVMTSASAPTNIFKTHKSEATELRKRNGLVLYSLL